jgi:hypothetical protein
MVPKATFTFTAGTPKLYLDSTSSDSGQAIQRHFCGDCGSPLTAQGTVQHLIVIKAGTLDEESRGQLDLAVEIFSKRKDKWARASDGNSAHQRRDDRPN